MGSANDVLKLVVGPAGAIVVLSLFVAFLVAALWGLRKGWWVPGPTYDDLHTRYDRLDERFNRVVDAAIEGASLSATAIDKVSDKIAPKHGRSRKLTSPSSVPAIRPRTLRRKRRP